MVLKNTFCWVFIDVSWKRKFSSFTTPWFYWPKRISNDQISWLHLQKIWVILSWFTVLFFLLFPIFDLQTNDITLNIIIVFFFMCFSFPILGFENNSYDSFFLSQGDKVWREHQSKKKTRFLFVSIFFMYWDHFFF